MILCLLLLLNDLSLCLYDDLLLGDVFICLLGLREELLEFDTKLLEQGLVLDDHIVLLHLYDRVGVGLGCGLLMGLEVVQLGEGVICW